MRCSLPFPPPAPGCRILLRHTSEPRRASAPAGEPWRGEAGGLPAAGPAGPAAPAAGPHRLLPTPERRGSSLPQPIFGEMRGVYPALIYKLRPGGRGQKAGERWDAGVRLRGDRPEAVSQGRCQRRAPPKQQVCATLPRVSGKASRTRAEEPA